MSTTPTTLARFEMPNHLAKNEDTATENYAQFIAEPFESGYGQTVGNSLRRVLLSSLEGAAITQIRIQGAEHEFATLPGVVEDVVEVVLNLKKVKFQHAENFKETRTLRISVNKEGLVTAGDIEEDNHYSVVNPDQIICTLDQKVRFECELDVRVGRGFATGEENKTAHMAIGTIPIDSIFSPITRVKYAVENSRVGQKTDYDKLILDIWTDGRIDPKEALLQSSAILRHHFDVFVNYDDSLVDFEEKPEDQSEESAELKKLLNMSVNEIELSVRAANCLNNANIQSVGELAMKSEPEMLKYRNFGKKSLNEIKDKMAELGLGLGMNLDPSLVETDYNPPAMEGGSGEEEEDDNIQLLGGGLEELISQNID